MLGCSIGLLGGGSLEMGGLAEGRSIQLAFLWGLLAGLGEMVGWLGLEDTGGGFGSLVEEK